MGLMGVLVVEGGGLWWLIMALEAVCLRAHISLSLCVFQWRGHRCRHIDIGSVVNENLGSVCEDSFECISDVTARNIGYRASTQQSSP